MLISADIFLSDSNQGDQYSKESAVCPFGSIAICDRSEV